MRHDPRDLDTYNDHDEPDHVCPRCGTDAAPRLVDLDPFTGGSVCPCGHVYWTAARADAPTPPSAEVQP